MHQMTITFEPEAVFTCPTCGRRIEMHGDVAVLVQVGDPLAQHAGASGGLHIGVYQDPDGEYNGTPDAWDEAMGGTNG